MKPSLNILLLVVFGLGFAGCETSSSALPPGPEPTATPLTITIEGQIIELVPGVNVLPEIYEAAKSPELLANSDWVFVDGYWDIMPRGVQIPLEVEETPLQAADQLPFAGFPETWETYTWPGLVLEFDYPSDWQVETLEKGARLHPQDGAFVIQVESYPNPLEASLSVWLAEYGPDMPGEVLGELEDAIDGKPVFRQQVMVSPEHSTLSGETIYLWMVSGERVYGWTAWPGDQAETYDLLMYVAATLR